ncbi:MAG: ABC transporter substrate-binding protein [Desulfitobacterium sp.]|nr:ABC transporter substrate-binding protein [Desulfitobacterium sp.]
MKKALKKIKKPLAVILASSLLLLAGCGTTDTSGEGEELSSVRLGYFPNITHASAMIGIENGYFQDELGENVNLEAAQFPNGSLLMDALVTGQIDIGYVGPEPAITRYLQGGDVVVLAGAATGGNVVVAAKDSNVNSIKDLDGKIVATPSIACTHDISLKILMQEEGLAMENQGGTVKQVTQKPADTLTLFQQKQLDAAVVSEPWAAQMEDKVGAKVIVDNEDMPWEGKLPSAVLVTSKKFASENPEIVKAILRGHVTAVDFIKNSPDEATRLTQKNLAELAKQELPLEILERSFDRTEITYEVDGNILNEMEQWSKDLGLVQGNNEDVTGLVDLTLLKEVLRE